MTLTIGRSISLSLFATMIVASGCGPAKTQSGMQTCRLLPASTAADARGDSCAYLIYLPRDYDGQSWPLVVFLHDEDQRGDDLELVRQTGLPRLIDGNEFPFIAAAPQCPPGQWWSPAEIDRVLNDVCARYAVDADRICVTGVGMGALATWNIAAAWPDRFAAIAPVSGPGLPSMAHRLSKVPARVFHGSRDRVSPIEQSQQMVEAMRSYGGNVEFTIYPRGGHDVWKKAYTPSLTRWMLSQRRNEGGQTVEAVAKTLHELLAQPNADELYQRSQVTMLLTLIRAQGRTDVDYATLMAVSGWSAQFVYEPKQQWVSFVPPCDTVANACGAVGHGVTSRRPASAEEAFEIIGRSVDEGKGVLAEWKEHLIFCGYTNTGKVEDRRVFFVCNVFAPTGKWWTWEEFCSQWWSGPAGKTLWRLTDPRPAQDSRQVAKEVMRRLVDCGANGQWCADAALSRAASPATGWRGMQAYAEDLADVSKQMGEHFNVGWGCFSIYPQWTARICTREYLAGCARLFDAQTRRHVEAAVKEYSLAERAWKQWQQYLGRQEHVRQEQRQEAYQRAWKDPAARKAGAAAAMQAAAHERNAIAHISNALAEMDRQAAR